MATRVRSSLMQQFGWHSEQMPSRYVHLDASDTYHADPENARDRRTRHETRITACKVPEMPLNNSSGAEYCSNCGTPMSWKPRPQTTHYLMLEEQLKTFDDFVVANPDLKKILHELKKQAAENWHFFLVLGS